MKNKKLLIILVILIVLCGIGVGVYQYYSSHLFNQDGTISDGHQDLINHLQGVEDAQERTKQIDFALEQNLITESEANELRNK